VPIAGPEATPRIEKALIIDIAAVRSCATTKKIQQQKQRRQQIKEATYLFVGYSDKNGLTNSHSTACKPGDRAT
jgi:hypothetical protein